MPAGAKVLGDGTIGGEEALGVARRLEPLHTLLSLTGRLVGVLRPIVEIPLLTMCHLWEDLPLGGSITLQFIGDNYARYIGQAFKELVKELLGGFLVPTALAQDIQDVALLIDRPPQIVMFALDRQKYFIDVAVTTHKTIDLVVHTQVYRLKRDMQARSARPAFSVPLYQNSGTEGNDETPVGSSPTRGR